MTPVQAIIWSAHKISIVQKKKLARFSYMIVCEIAILVMEKFKINSFDYKLNFDIIKTTEVKV